MTIASTRQWLSTGADFDDMAVVSVYTTLTTPRGIAIVARPGNALAPSEARLL
jgi:hypothetical protein